MRNNQFTFIALVIIGLLSGCQSLQTGGKVVDRDRGEVIISAAGDQRSALPDGSKDTSIIKARERSEALVRSNPKDTKALLALAQLQLVQDRYDDAEETSRKVLLIDLKNTEAKKSAGSDSPSPRQRGSCAYFPNGTWRRAIPRFQHS